MTESIKLPGTKFLLFTRQSWHNGLGHHSGHATQQQAKDEARRIEIAREIACPGVASYSLESRITVNWVIASNWTQPAVTNDIAHSIANDLV